MEAGPRIVGYTFLADPPKILRLEQGFRFHRGGEVLAPFEIVYETFGELSPERDNAILVCHALSPGAHAAGKYTPADPKPGWWDGLIGYGKGIDLHRYFVVCVNFPGSPWGTTGPRSLDPAPKRPYGSRYPWVSVEDMVESQRRVADHLGSGRIRRHLITPIAAGTSPAPRGRGPPRAPAGAAGTCRCGARCPNRPVRHRRRPAPRRSVGSPPNCPVAASRSGRAFTSTQATAAPRSAIMSISPPATR